MREVICRGKLYRVILRDGAVRSIDVWTPANPNGYTRKNGNVTERMGWWRQVSVRGATGKALARHIEETGK